MRSNERNRYKTLTYKDTLKRSEICRLNVNNRLNIRAQQLKKVIFS